MSLNRFKLPILNRVRTINNIDDIPDHTQYEEVIYDYNSMSYKTMSQEVEIRRLKEQLIDKEKERSKKLQNIISYFYKK